MGDLIGEIILVFNLIVKMKIFWKKNDYVFEYWFLSM